MPDGLIHPTALIEDGANISETATIGAYCIIGSKVTIGDHVHLASHVTVSGDTTIGERTKIQPFVVIGGAPQHLGYKDENTRLIIGTDNVIREHTTMNIGTTFGRGVTTIGNQNYFMTGAHVGHDCIVGNKNIFANNATLGGHVEIGNGIFLGGLSAVHQQCKIGDFAFLGGCAAVIHDVIPFGSANGNYAQLAGLNLIGLKRKNLPREAIDELRRAYKLLFFGNAPFQDRIATTRQTFQESQEVQRILKFLDAPHQRPIMMADRG